MRVLRSAESRDVRRIAIGCCLSAALIGPSPASAFDFFGLFGDKPPAVSQQALPYLLAVQSDGSSKSLDKGLKVRAMVLPDTFIDQDSPAAMYAKAGLDAKGIVMRVLEALGREADISAVQLA